MWTRHDPLGQCRPGDAHPSGGSRAIKNPALGGASEHSVGRSIAIHQRPYGLRPAYLLRCCCYWIAIPWHQLHRNASIEALEAGSRSIGCRTEKGSVVIVSSVQSAQAITSPSVHGAWQLLSYDVEQQSNGDTFAPMGHQPTGYVIFTPEGRLSFMLSAEGANRVLTPKSDLPC